MQKITQLSVSYSAIHPLPELVRSVIAFFLQRKKWLISYRVSVAKSLNHLKARFYPMSHAACFLGHGGCFLSSLGSDWCI